MSKSTKTRRCPQCGIVVKSSSLEVLLEHMESSTMCKDAIETCTGCLMKFPDEKTLLKHLSLKKKCQEIYNMGLLDPSIASDFTSSEANRDAASSVAYYHSSGQKRKKINEKEMWGDDTQATFTNSFATYAFPHLTNKFGTSNSGGDSLKQSGHVPKLKFSDNIGMTKELDLDYCHPCNAMEKNNGKLSYPKELQSQSTDGDSSSSDEYDESSFIVNEDPYSDDDDEEQEEQEQVNIEAERDSLKVLANMMRRKHVPTLNLSPEIQMLMDLYLRTIGRGASLNTFDDVLQWAIDHSLVDSHVPTRKPMLKQIADALYGKEYLSQCKPRQRVVQLCSGRVAEVTVFDVRPIIVDLLCNEDLIVRDNLVFGHDDFTDHDAGLVGNMDVYDDVNTGSWWKETIIKLKEEHPEIQDQIVLWPLILFIDGVSHGEFTNLNQEPVLLTFSAFKRTVRNKAQSWRPLAYIDYKGNMKGKVDPVTALNEYHQVLGAVFEDLIRIQSTGMNWTFTLPNEAPRDVILFFPVQFIIGDCEGHDKLCGRFKSHNNTPGLVRDCDIPTAMADDPTHVCHFYTADEMEAFDDADLKQRSFHRIESPCHTGMDFGASKEGIYGAAIPESHHVYLLGACKEVGDLYPNSLSSASLAHTDNVLSYLVTTTRFSPSLKLPLVSPFRAGINKVRKLKAVERNGKIFAIYCILMSSSYVRFLHDNPKVGDVPESVLAELKQQAKVLEKLLCFHDWLFAQQHKKETVDPDREGTDSLSTKKIRSLMQEIKIYFPRTHGMGWKLTKFHQLLHFPRNIGKHGSALNFDGGRPEYYGKVFCKDHATRTQRRQINLAKQTAQRYFDNSVVTEAERVLAHTKTLTYKDVNEYQYLPSNHDGTKRTIEGTRVVQNQSHILQAKLCQLSIDPQNEQTLVFDWSNKTYSTIPGYQYQPAVYRPVAKRIWFSHNGGRLNKEDGRLQCYTECIIPDGSVVRAHPLFNSERPWHDWVMVQWGADGDYLPSKVMMLFDICAGDIEHFNEVGESRVPHNEEFLQKGQGYALVQTVTGEEFRFRSRDPNRKFHFPSNIASRYTMESHMRIIEIESIESIALVVENNIGSLGDSGDESEDNVVILFHERHSWKDTFLEL